MSIHEYLNNEAHFVPLGLNNDSPRWRGVRAPLGNTRENPRLGQQSRLIRIPTLRAAFWRFDLEDPHPRAGQPPLGPPRSGRPSGRPPPATGTAVATPAPASPPPVANATSKLFPSKKNAHQRGKAKGFGGRRGVTLRRGGSGPARVGHCRRVARSVGATAARAPTGHRRQRCAATKKI